LSAAALGSMWAGTDPAPGLASIGQAFDDDFLWHGQDTFHDSFCQDLATRPTEVLGLITNAADAV
jgi:arginine deiminase